MAGGIMVGMKEEYMPVYDCGYQPKKIVFYINDGGIVGLAIIDQDNQFHFAQLKAHKFKTGLQLEAGMEIEFVNLGAVLDIEYQRNRKS